MSITVFQWMKQLMQKLYIHVLSCAITKKSFTYYIQFTVQPTLFTLSQIVVINSSTMAKNISSQLKATLTHYWRKMSQNTNKIGHSVCMQKIVSCTGLS